MTYPPQGGGEQPNESSDSDRPPTDGQQSGWGQPSAAEEPEQRSAESDAPESPARGQQSSSGWGHQSTSGWGQPSAPAAPVESPSPVAGQQSSSGWGQPSAPAAPEPPAEPPSPVAGQQSSSGWGQPSGPTQQGGAPQQNAAAQYGSPSQPGGGDQPSASGWGSPPAAPASGYRGTAAPTQQFAVGGSAAAQQPPASPYGSSSPAQHYGGQPSASGFGAAPAPGPTGFGGQQNQPYGSQPYGAPAGYQSPPSAAGPVHQPFGGPPGYAVPHQQPGYPAQSGPGQPYGGGYPSAPPKKRNTGLIVTLAVVGVLVVAFAILIPTVFLAKTVLDPTAVQQDVAVQFQDQEGVGIELTCPQEMEVEVSRTYECTGTTEDSEDVTLVIEISDQDGNYTWQEKR